MERKKVEKNLKDWANSLGFRLPSESTLSPDYFAALGATPHRRQLWETVVELVQPRKKIERMRKEILAARLKGFLGKFGGKEGGDRFDLWMMQKKVEGNVREKRNEVSKLEKSILTKSSDLVLEICKMAETGKQCEEYKEKTLVLMLYIQRQKKMIGELELIIKSPDLELSDPCYQDLDSLKKEIHNLEELRDISQHFEVPTKNESSIKEGNLWEDVIRWKKSFHVKFKNLLEEIISNKNHGFSEKIVHIEETLNSSLAELKQKMTEKALEVMVNTKEGKSLNLKIEELINKLHDICQKDESFNNSFFNICPEKEKCLEIFKNHAKALAWKNYQDFLQNELTKFEEKKNQRGSSQDPCKKFELVMKSMERVTDEIHKSKLEKEQLTNDIVAHHDELLNLMKTVRKETNKDTYRTMVEESLASLKIALKKQIAIFIETPLDAFRKVETPSGRILFQCESLAHCLSNYGGEWEKFFIAMVIPPTRNVSKLLAELEKRKQLIAEAKEFISKWEKLVQSHKNIQQSLRSIKSDSRVSEKNFKDADGILWRISFKSEQLRPEIEFLKKILKNWMEQPYRLMIKETEIVNGLTFKQYEEAYRKENQ